MAKQTKGGSKTSAKTSKAKTKKAGKALSDKSLKSAKGGIIIVGGRSIVRRTSVLGTVTTR
jgi:hypothetical protein